MLNTCDTIKGKRRGKKRKTAAAESDPAISHSQPSADFARCYPAHCKPPSPATPEVETLRQFKAEWKRKTRGIPIDDTKRPKELLIVDLRDFEVYCSSHCERRAYELTSLHFLEVPMAKKLCFDGFVRLGKARYYIQGVPIQDSSVEGYGDEENPNVVTYVRSELAAHDPEYDIWYRLNEPSPHYKRFHDAFLWVAQMGKHVIDYMQSPRSLDSFRTDFHLWLMRRFARDLDFQRWHTTFRNQVDFRVAVNAYIEYFYHQAYNLPNHKLLLAQPLWSECMAKGMTAIKPRESAVKYTLATPEVHACFKHMYFGKQIQEKRPTTKVHMQQEQRKRRLGFAKGPLPTSVARPPDCQPYAGSPVRVGDVVALVPDTTDASVWRDTNWDWLAYVQGTETLENGTQRLAVLWIYRHHETNLSKAKYPFANEVFLSDNCNCTDGELRSTDIKGKYDIDWSPSVVGTNRFFVRQTYITQESSFVSVTEEHKTCMCKKENSSPIDNYRPGETVYLRKSLQKEEILDPVVVYKIYELKGLVLVRKLSRLGRDYATLAEKAHRSNVPPNEVVLTNQYEEVDVTRIQRRCFVRHVSRSDLLAGQVPFPYNLEGAGDLWIISMRLTLGRGGQNLEFLHALPPIMKQSPDIGWVKKLRGLSLFSGGGSLDRGLEDGGAVKFQTAVDSSANAIHTHRANARNAEKLRLYFGSVDALLDTALDGKSLKLVAQVGEVEFIAAGSPCPGFSALQPDYKNLKSLKNASHISTFCSFVDLYRPLYGILENVVNMASTRTGHENENVLSQVVACLVSMGYQVNQYIMDAWSYGSAQQRSRLIITIAAPGLTPMTQQWHTHSRPYEETSGKSLGKLPNGERFGEREHYPTPFPYVHASTASFGLPEIGNSIVQTCVPYPDHRNTSRNSLLDVVTRMPRD
ncbi:S-adenosyl-L-methionine-dependent methyltransferase [Stemphylium lycopersici]|uniref:DNA (cytosine-5-)-methyltransferase n=1 Tax=Stemphylium lycopersici TaxID=183478 RepID=A0A364MTR5_STELY|nr:S-adenosyl-L-methionine-dependent methyltransferase [Stemphylium lycopersici]